MPRPAPLPPLAVDTPAASYLASAHARAAPKLTALERDVAKERERVVVVSGSVVDVIRTSLPKPPKSAKTPSVLYLSASTERALRAFHETSKASLGLIGKLWARHMKVEEQVEALANGGVAVAVGTPNRVLKLCRDGALDLSEIRLVVLDCVPDAKSFHILTMPGVMEDTFALYREFFAPLSGGRDTLIALVCSDGEAKSSKSPAHDKKRKAEASSAAPPAPASTTSKKQKKDDAR